MGIYSPVWGKYSTFKEKVKNNPFAYNLNTGKKSTRKPIFL